MIGTRTTAFAAVALAASLGLAACGSNNNSSAKTQPSSSGSASASAGGCASGSLSGSGSTFQKNIEQQWIASFGQQCSGAQVNYTGTGSGAGIQQFGLGTIDFAGSDVVMKPTEQTKANSRCGGTAIHIPVTAGGIAIEYNLSGVSSLQLSAATLAGIFQGQIKTWDDPKIKADNPGVSLPSKPILPFHRSDGSGTTSVFSSFLKADAKGVWTLGSGKTLPWPSGSGQAAKGSDGVTQGVKQTDGGITYSEVSYAKAAGLPTAKVKGASGSYEDITSASVSQAISSGFAIAGSGNDLAGKLNYTAMAGYPISTVSYVIVCQHYSDTAKATLLKDYLTYAVTQGQGAADQLGFAPLPSSIVSRDQTSIASIS